MIARLSNILALITSTTCSSIPKSKSILIVWTSICLICKDCSLIQPIVIVCITISKVITIVLENILVSLGLQAIVLCWIWNITYVHGVLCAKVQWCFAWNLMLRSKAKASKHWCFEIRLLSFIEIWSISIHLVLIFLILSYTSVCLTNQVYLSVLQCLLHCLLLCLLLYLLLFLLLLIIMILWIVELLIDDIKEVKSGIFS